MAAGLGPGGEGVGLGRCPGRPGTCQVRLSARVWGPTSLRRAGCGSLPGSGAHIVTHVPGAALCQGLGAQFVKHVGSAAPVYHCSITSRRPGRQTGREGTSRSALVLRLRGSAMSR